MPTTAAVVVAGHICLDIIPSFADTTGARPTLLQPGALTEIGPATLCTGGAVSNTGLALHRLGVPTRLMATIGDDLFGTAVRQIVEREGGGLARGLRVRPGATSSYSLVISPPGVDRTFLHCPGTNATFGADDIAYDELTGVRLFHFGYPPLMERMFADAGRELETVFHRVRARGPATSLDMSMPDPAGPAGHVDWRAVLQRVLPHVDLFLPSLEETLFMLRRRQFEQWSATGPLIRHCDGHLLTELADELLGWGAAVVGLKLGDQGLYVRTTSNADRLAPLKRAAQHKLDDWRARELYTPCFQVNVAGTTGCGDATIAGFLAALLHALPLPEALSTAVAVGACNVERPDALGGIPTWAAVQQRRQAGWPRRPTSLNLPNWRWNDTRTHACGPADAPTSNA